MARPADQEMTAIEKSLLYSQFPRGSSMPHHTGPHGDVPVSGGKGMREKCGQEPLLWSSLEGMVRQSKQV